jgi:hypothetical protein
LTAASTNLSTRRRGKDNVDCDEQRTDNGFVRETIFHNSIEVIGPQAFLPLVGHLIAKAQRGLMEEVQKRYI